MKRLGISGWNSHQADRATLARYIAERVKAGDVAICLTEVRYRHRDLRDIARDHGWRMIAEEPRNPNVAVVPEQGDTVLLLSPSVRDVEWEVVALSTRWWVFSHKRLHEPRRLIRATGTIDGQRVELLACHGPTGGNKEAVAEFLREVRDILERTSPGVLSIAFGDFNIRVPEARKWARGWARVAGHGPDLAVVRGGRVRGRRGSKRGSDHYDLAYRIKIANRRSKK